MNQEQSTKYLRVSIFAISAILCGSIPFLMPEWSSVLAQQIYSTDPPDMETEEVIKTVCPNGSPPNSSEFQRDCDALVGAAADEQIDALGQITSDNSGIVVDASQNSVRVQAQNIGSRLAALRAGVTGISIGGLGFNINGQSLTEDQLASLSGAALGQTGGAASADTAFDFGRLGIFLNGTVILGDRDGSENQDGFDFDTQGITAGLDYRFTDNFILGAAFGYLNTDIDLDAGAGDLDTDGYNFTLYGTFYQADRFYVDASATYGENDYEQDRNINYRLNSQGVVVDQTMSADYDGDQWNLTLGAGYDFSWKEWTFGPIGRLEYINADVDGYRESASIPGDTGSGWTVEIDDQEFESFTFSLGGQVSYAWSQTWGVLVPQARFEWVHEFEDDASTVSGRFLGDPSGETFRFLTDEPDENYFHIGVGVSAVFPQGRSLFLHYQTVQGFEDLDQHTINAGLRWEF